jgi:nucleotide-binding universal stress UspA family protein
MHTRILIPTDGSDLSDEAIQYGTALAKAANAKVTGITVLRPFHVFTAEPEMLEETAESYRKRMTTVAAQRLAKLEQAAEAAGVSCELVHVEHEHPYKAIVDTANAKACDLIVMASHGRRGISALVRAAKRSRCSPTAQSPSLSIVDLVPGCLPPISTHLNYHLIEARMATFQSASCDLPLSSGDLRAIHFVPSCMRFV